MTTIYHARAVDMDIVLLRQAACQIDCQSHLCQTYGILWCSTNTALCILLSLPKMLAGCEFARHAM